MAEQLSLLDHIDNSVCKSEVDDKLQAISEQYKCALHSFNVESVNLVISGFILGYTNHKLSIIGFNELADGFKLGRSYAGKKIIGLSNLNKRVDHAKKIAECFLKQQKIRIARFEEAARSSKSLISNENWINELIS